MAVFHGGSVPLWAAVLSAAETWGCTPWEIAGGNKLTWFMRWQAYQRIRNSKTEYDLTPPTSDEWQTQ